MSGDGLVSEQEVPDGVIAAVVARSRRLKSDSCNVQQRQGADIIESDHEELLAGEHVSHLYKEHDDLFGSCQIINSYEESLGISWYKAMFLIVNAALGAGMLNFPKAFHEAGGLVSGNIVHIVFVSFALGSLLILAGCAHDHNCKTYQEVVAKMLGPWWGLVSSLCISLYCYVTCITFIIIIGDQFDRALASYVGSDFCKKWYLNRRFTMAVSSLLLIFPCCLKRIDGLRFMSYVGVLSVWYLTVMIVAEFYTGNYDRGPVVIWDMHWRQVFDVVPTICFGYQCHVSSIPIYSCLKKRDAKTFSKACVLAIIICVMVYTLSANYGYLTFGSQVDGDVLLSYDARKPEVLIGVILLAIKSWTTYPILLFCVREAIGDMYAQIRNLEPLEIIHGEPFRRKLIAGLLWTSSVVMAIFTPNINIVVKLLGSLAAMFIFVFPGICLLKSVLCLIDSRGGSKTRKDVGLILVATIYLMVGMFAFGLAFTLGVLNIINPDPVHILCVV